MPKQAPINAFHYVRSPTPLIIDISTAWIHTAKVNHIIQKNKSFISKCMKHTSECMKPLLQCMKYHKHPLTSNLSSSLASVLQAQPYYSECNERTTAHSVSVLQQSVLQAQPYYSEYNERTTAHSVSVLQQSVLQRSVLQAKPYYSEHRERTITNPSYPQKSLTL